MNTTLMEYPEPVAESSFYVGLSDSKLSPEYIRLLNQYPVLDTEQEQRYARQWTEHKSIEAAHTLVFSNLRGVVYVARNYAGYGLALMDLVQEGTVGLMKAVKNYRLNSGIRLFAYALPWIKAEVQSYIIRNWKMVKGATTDARKKLFFNLRRLKNEALPLEENIAHISNALKVSPDDVLAMDQYLYSPNVGLDNVIDVQDAHTPATLLEEKQEHQTAERALSLMRQLPEREQRILHARFIQEPPATLGLLSEELGISIERVRQLEKQATTRLRKFLGQPRLGSS